MVSTNSFLLLGLALAKHDPARSAAISMRRFRSLFGTTPAVCAELWRRVGDDRPDGTSPAHMLWMLLFLKAYANEAQTRSIIGCDEKSIRKWV